MNIKVVLVSAACLCLLQSASGASLKGAVGLKKAILGAGIKGLLSKGSETVIIPDPGFEPVVETIPIHNVIINPDPIHIGPVPVVVPSPSIFGCISGLFSSVTNAVVSKTRAIGAFISGLKGPQHVVVLVANTTTTTTTTPKPVVVEVIVQEKERFAPYPLPVITRVSF